jgi:hypothetical protein
MVHRQMFDDINARAVQTLLRLILQRPSDVEEISHALESRGNLARAFGNLDVNGDGRVTFTEILSYNGVGADAIRDFLSFLGRKMELGAGGEDVSALPGVSLEMLQASNQGGTLVPTDDVALLQADAGGLSSLSSPAAGLASPTSDSLPNVQLAGFADGSVRFVNGDGRPVSFFRGASFFGNLSPPDAATTNAWGGVFTLTDQAGNAVQGILIGVISPGPERQQTLHALLVATRAVGDVNGVVGNGDVTINWGDGLTGPFRAELRILPAIQRRGGR